MLRTVIDPSAASIKRGANHNGPQPSSQLEGATAAAPRDRSTALGYAMPNAKKPLEPDDFPVNAEEKKIKKHDGTPLADTDDPAVAADVAERFNDDEARREEDKWSA